MNNTNNVEVGDKIQLKGFGYDFHEVLQISDFRTLGILCDNQYTIKHFQMYDVINVIKAGTKPHPHKDLIIAWAHGAEIECYTQNRFILHVAPVWNECLVYRVKPSKSPNQVEKESIEAEMIKLADRLKELDV